MSNLNSRVSRLEKRKPPPHPTWKDFVTGKWIPSEIEWCEFLGGSEEYDKLKAWAESFTPEEHEQIEHVIKGDEFDNSLGEKLLSIPESAKSVLEELEKVIQEQQPKATGDEAQIEEADKSSQTDSEPL